MSYNPEESILNNPSQGNMSNLIWNYVVYTYGETSHISSLIHQLGKEHLKLPGWRWGPRNPHARHTLSNNQLPLAPVSLLHPKAVLVLSNLVPQSRHLCHFLCLSAILQTSGPGVARGCPSLACVGFCGALVVSFTQILVLRSSGTS